ncbi:hypothetical protein Pmani_039257 [Petrolisthes manimaculis]|uniref:Uncharacterized protein n=1 Tax=Petrolisthes manimaculis TaxID=1843537 RepID=A0AAE1TLI0_9EUCA|nr:hypothetical protein Pmani_039257 [Petrolisthes manimaculis]
MFPSKHSTLKSPSKHSTLKFPSKHSTLKSPSKHSTLFLPNHGSLATLLSEFKMLATTLTCRLSPLSEIYIWSVQEGSAEHMTLQIRENVCTVSPVDSITTVRTVRLESTTSNLYVGPACL